MKINTRKMLLGLALLGATTFSGFSAPASAKPKHDKEERKEIREERKELRKARKDVRKAGSPEERRDAREELREEREEYREERRDRREDWREDRRDRRDDDDRNYNRPNYNNSTRTIEGVVIEDLRGNDFTIRTRNGQTLRVVAVNGESNRIDRGDVVRVTGRVSGSRFNATRVSIIRSGNSNDSNSRRTIEGIVISDLRGNDFSIRTSNGQTVRVVAVRGESDRIDRGDIVRVTGSYSGNTFNARTVSILRDR
ncbi:MAG TPA: hypothetical protein VGB45_00320 [Abditibacterium sp.]|jgi:translation initiation factor IF-1/gas vesicle protein